MTFKEGLLKARGQIAFVTALVLSTAFIIYLETLDTDERIQSRVSAELARQRGATASQPLISAVTTVVRRAQDAYGQEPEAAANRASVLTSVSSAVQLGIIASAEGQSQIQRILDDMERRPGERNVALASALAVTAATFPSLQDRVSRLLPPS